MYRYAALLVLGLFASPASADELIASHGSSIKIGDLYGVAYYTETDDGYRVVTTLTGEEGSPVRFVATLQEGEKLSISVPGELSEFGQAIEFSRAGGKLFMAKTEASADLARLGE